jgi:hypothetical protein
VPPPGPAWVHAVQALALVQHAVLPAAWRHAVLRPAWGRAVATVPCRQGAVTVAATAPGRRAETVTETRTSTASSSSKYSRTPSRRRRLRARRLRLWREPSRVQV